MIIIYINVLKMSNSDNSVSELQLTLGYHISNFLAELQPINNKMFEVEDVGEEIFQL